MLFWYKLALKDGITVKQAMRRYDGNAFAEWQAFEQVFGPITLHERLDVLLARSDWLLAEAHRDRKKQKKPFPLDRFIPKWWTPLQERKERFREALRKRRPMTGPEMWAAFRELMGDGEDDS